MPTYYDCHEDPEYLSHQDVSEAIEAWADDLDPDKPLPEMVRVYFYEREEINQGMLDRHAEHVVESVLEYLDEEYGSPDDYTEPTEMMKVAARVFLRVVKAEYRVWRCKQTGSQTFRVSEYVKDKS